MLHSSKRSSRFAATLNKDRVRKIRNFRQHLAVQGKMIATER